MALRTGGEKTEVVFDESFGANMVGALDTMQVALLEVLPSYFKFNEIALLL